MNIKKILILPVLLSFLVSCEKPEQQKAAEPETKLPDQAGLKSSLANLSSLGTVEYSLSKVIAASDDQWYSVGSRKALMSCKANVVAGVDFAEIQVTALDKKAKSVSISLPPARVILLDIPPGGFSIISVEEGLLRAKFTAQELNKSQQLAQKDIEKKITELRILTDAKTNASRFLHSWLKSLGFETINIQ